MRTRDNSRVDFDQPDASPPDNSSDQLVDYDYLDRLMLWLPRKLAQARRGATSLWLFAIFFLAIMLWLPAMVNPYYVSDAQIVQMTAIAFIVWLPFGALLLVGAPILLSRCTPYVNRNMSDCKYLVKDSSQAVTRLPNWFICHVLGISAEPQQRNLRERETVIALNEYCGCCFRYGRAPFPVSFIYAEAVVEPVTIICLVLLILSVLRHPQLGGHGMLAEHIWGSWLYIPATMTHIAFKTVRYTAFLSALSVRVSELEAARPAEDAAIG